LPIATTSSPDAFIQSSHSVICVNNPNNYPYAQSIVSKNICLVVGLACLLGFLVDALVLSTPFNPTVLEWRINFLQQISDRSILFLVSVALLLYSTFEKRQLRRGLSSVCLIIGVVCLMSSIVVIHDSISFRDKSFRDLNSQERQLQTSIKDSQSSGELPADISASEIRQASKSLSNRAEILRRNTGRDITKVGVASVGNLVALSFGLIGLSRLGLKRPSSYK